MKKILKTIKHAVTPPYKSPPQQAPGAFVDVFPGYKDFFVEVREGLGPLRQGQVDGFMHILDKWREASLTDPRWLSYMLATAWHETAATMQPITEYGNVKYLRAKPYWPFIGRGYVQLTWRANYKRYGLELSPVKALDPDIAAHVMIDGMTKGIFTGKSLKTYFNEQIDDPVNARRIINGTDRAQMVAGYHAHFLKACKAAPKLFEVGPILTPLS